MQCRGPRQGLLQSFELVGITVSPRHCVAQGLPSAPAPVCSWRHGSVGPQRQPVSCSASLPDPQPQAACDRLEQRGTLRESSQEQAHCHSQLQSRRWLASAAVLLATALRAPSGNAQLSEDGESLPPVDTQITDKVFLDVGMCSTMFRSDRKMGDKTILCSEPNPTGRIVIGLYGKAVPTTVKNFLSLVQAQSLAGTTFHKVVPGSYIQGGRQGSLRMGEVQPPYDLPTNPETLRSESFRLEHTRPGTVSLSLSENDDEPMIKQRPQYRNTEFLITTGPGPATFLDGQNVVFGRVLSGIDTVTTVANVPTFKVDKRIQWFNEFAGMIGDERAAKARARWTKPQKPVVITACGVL